LGRAKLHDTVNGIVIVGLFLLCKRYLRYAGSSPPGGLCVVNAVVVALAANGGYDGYEAFIEKK
jgi:hypothetical protein